ncbi:hypothetical protein FRC11_014714, partial [Ceratobasidium sp. 423]
MFSLVHCVSEYKREGSGANQAMMGIVSAMYQKKLLGLKQFVFGIFQLQSGFIDVVAAAWQNDRITIYKVGCYSLSSSTRLIEFYLALQGINQLARVYSDALKNSGRALADSFRINPPKDVWANDPLATIREVPGESNSQEQRGGPNVQSGLGNHLSTLEAWDGNDRIRAFVESTRVFARDDSGYLADSSGSSDNECELPQSPPVDKLAGQTYANIDSAASGMPASRSQGGMENHGPVLMESTRHLTRCNSGFPVTGSDSSDDSFEIPESPCGCGRTT